MDEILEKLNGIEDRLSRIEIILSKPPLHEAVCKSAYSCNELAELTSVYGIKRYRPYTVRLACNDKRIPEAEKLENGAWAVPRHAVLRILEEGIPPERKNGHRVMG